MSKGWVIETQIPSLENEPILLTAKNTDDIIGENLIPGSRVIFWARESMSPELPIPGLFSWQDYLQQKGISRHFILDRKIDLEVLSAPRGALTFIYRYHEKLLINIRQRFPEPDVCGLLSGLILGDKRLLESSLKASFQKAGIMHLLVVSGLQVSLWAGFVWFFLTRLLRAPRPAALVGTLIAIWMFALFVGLNPPVLRSAVMLSILTLVPLLKREIPTLTRLFLAALAFLVYQPSLIKDASFLLSFASTFGILLGWERWSIKNEQGCVVRYAKTLAGTSLFAAYAILPILAHFFHQISLVGPLANMILVPSSGILLVSGIVYFSFLNFIPVIGALTSQVLLFSCIGFIKLANLFANVPLSVWATKPWDSWLILAWAAFGLFWLFKEQRKILIAASLCFLAIHLSQQAMRQEKLFLLSDGYQYQAIYFEKGFKSWLYSPAPINPYLKTKIPEFLSSRGHQKTPPSPPTLKKPSPFDPTQTKSIKLNCGKNTLLWPLSPFPIMEGEEIPSRILNCDGRHFL